MRARLVPALIIVASLGVGLSARAQMFKPPIRRAGYWQTTMNMGPRTMTTAMCTDETLEKSMTVMGQGVTEKDCPQHDYHPIPGGWAFNSTCTIAGRTDVSSGTVTGDMQTNYHMEMTTHPSNGPERHMTMDVKWLGPCPAGRVPGDMVMPGGMVMNMSKMAQMGR